ncbi:helix-turn-helix domain-containing protein [Rhodanobacter lindaniclasticus]|nr:helix-turn-helix domain-containing protein [Rhodanobacter lindaniclasticus]
MSASKSAVLSMLADGLSQREVSRRTGVSRKTLYRWAEDLPKPDAAPRRHIYVPDTQVRQGVPTDHLPWVGKYIAKMKPDVIVLAGDWYDCPSMSTHDAPGSRTKEGARYVDDIKAGNDALDAFMKPIHAAKAGGAWKPEIHVTLGNHCDRIRRWLEANPVMDGAIGYQDFGFVKHGIKVHDFLCPVIIDGIAYSHYWAAPMTGRAYGGMASTILGKLGHSFTQGHRQVFEYASRNSQVTGHEIIGLIAGACYVHAEPYLGYQGNSHFRGIVVKNEVRDGHYDLMRVSLDYLARQNVGMSLRKYLESKYPKSSWEHIK